MADIGAKLAVTGESTFNKAMREAAKNTKALGAELKLAEAQFKATGNAEELMSQKDKILKEQLEQQKKAVDTATAALEALEKNGFEANSSKVMEWRAKLANAQAQVLELESAIKENAAGAEQAGQAYDSLGESMQNAAMDADTAKANIGNLASGAGNAADVIKGMGAKFSWDGLHDTLSGINAKIDAVISRAVQMGKAIWEAGVDATVWADDLITQSVTTGIDTQTLQKWGYAARFVDTSVDTIVTARTKLLANMSSTSKDMALNFNSLHVATRNVDGTIRGLDDVFWDVIGALGEIDDETTRDALAMKVLGKNAKELNPLIEAGREEWEKYANRAPLISDEQISSLGSANDSIEDMNAQLEALKLDALAYLAPTIQTVADAISAASKSLREFLDSDEGQQALTRLQGAISNLITDFTELDFGKILSDASSNITGIINGFSSILEQKGAIIGGLEAIGGAALFLKLAEAATNAMTLFTNLKLLKTVGGIGAGAAAAEAGAAAATGGASTAAGAAAGGVAGAIATKAATAAAGVVAKVPIFAAGYMGVTAILDQTETGRTLRDTGDLGKTLEAAGEEVSNYVESVQENIATFGEDWANLWDAFKRDVLGFKDTVDVVKDAPAAGISDHDLEILRDIIGGDLSAYAFDDMDLSSIAQQLPGSMLAQMLNMWGSAESWYESAGDDDLAVEMAQEILDNFVSEVDGKSGEANEAIESTVQGAMDAGEAAIGTQPETMGANTAIGFGNGILREMTFAVNAAQTMVDAVIATIVSGMDIGSPSKVMAQMGEYVGQGFAQGIDSTQGLVRDSAEALSGVVLRAPELPASGSTGAGGSADVPALLLAALSQMVVQIDGQDAGRIMLPTMEELMADQMMSRRYES